MYQQPMMAAPPQCDKHYGALAGAACVFCCCGCLPAIPALVFAYLAYSHGSRGECEKGDKYAKYSYIATALAVVVGIIWIALLIHFDVVRVKRTTTTMS